MNESTKQKAIEILAGTESPRGAALIEQFVWMNTATPKYQVGEPVWVRPQGTSILRDVPLSGRPGWDHQSRRVGEVVARVVEVKRLVRDMTFHYQVEYETDLEEGEIRGSHLTSHTAFATEGQLRRAESYAPTKWSNL